MCVQLFLSELLFRFMFSCSTVRLLSFVAAISVAQCYQMVKCGLMFVLGVLDVEGE